MHSRSLTHYPLQLFRDGEKMLKNPVTKSVFKNRPEERIRLKIIEYLIHDLNWPSSRIATEAPLKLEPHKHSKRADIIAYNADFEPELLIECKAEKILLDEKAGVQISRYNQLVEARYLLLSNGLADHWFEIGDKATELEEVPYKEHDNSIHENWTYWQDRGFTGNRPDSDELCEWIIQEADYLYKEQLNPQNIHYFNFDEAPSEFHLQGYYKVIPYNSRYRFALAFGNTPEGENRFNVVLNKEGQNLAILSLVLDRIMNGHKANTLLQTERGFSELDFSALFDADFKSSLADKIEDLYQLILKHS